MASVGLDLRFTAVTDQNLTEVRVRTYLTLVETQIKE